MGAIKIKSDQNIINNESELITPIKVREVNDVIDAQVEAAKTTLSTLQTNLSTTNTTVTTLIETVANLGNSANSGIPNGGTTGQVLAKNSNTNKDTAWVNPSSGLPSGGTTGQVLTKTSTGQVWAATLQQNLSGYATTSYVLEVAAQKLSTFGGTVSGNLTINGNVTVGSAITTPNPIKAAGLNSSYFYNDDTTINLQDRTFSNNSNLPFEYAGDYSEDYTERSLVDKAYVDSVASSMEDSPMRIVRKVLNGFPTKNTVITINHNLNTSYINVEIWVDFQDGGNITQQGAKKMVVDNTKLNIVKTGLNELKIDVLANYSTDQTLGTVEILIYSYPHATVTLLP
jgi:hypothetical protein